MEVKLLKQPRKRSYVSKNKQKAAHLQCQAQNADSISWSCNQKPVKPTSAAIKTQKSSSENRQITSTITIKYSKIKNYISDDNYYCYCTAKNGSSSVKSGKGYVLEAYIERNFAVSASHNVLKGAAFQLECTPPDSVPKVAGK